ncbi:hypothetical protein CXB51_024217 [Gossypium anomalum]|uniref:Uncharacterized protein n=1 Tax=Gossypium anomalum TaxID=47600 RepID=A0A8J6CPR9_9ROSI|nr:hypothetical protein CXB51_024217 [Gossypium anomalum]
MAYIKFIYEKARRAVPTRWEPSYGQGEWGVLKLERISIKVIVIEEAKDFERLAIDELIDSLQTFEVESLNCNEAKHSREKCDRNIALQVGDVMSTSQNGVLEDL